MDQIPSNFWMIIISVLALGLTSVFIYLAMLLKESMKTVREFRFLVLEAHEIMDSAKIIADKVNRVVDTVSSTADTVTEVVLKPFSFLSTLLTSAKVMASKFVKDEEN